MTVATQAGIDPRVIGTSVRLHRATRESRQTKALRYLVEGRIRLEHVHGDTVRATVRGTGALHVVTHEGSLGWVCTCPAVVSDCAHVLAVALVTVPEPRVMST